MQSPDHGHGEFAFAVKHLVHTVSLADHRLQVFGLEALLLHAKQNGINRVGWCDGEVLGFVRFNQREHGLKMRAGIAVRPWFMVEIRRYSSERAVVVRFSPDGVNGVLFGFFHVQLSTVAASIASYCAWVPTNLI